MIERAMTGAAMSDSASFAVSGDMNTSRSRWLWEQHSSFSMVEACVQVWLRLTDLVGCGLTIPCLDGVSAMSFRLFLTVSWRLHNLLHSMICLLRSHRSLGLMVHSSPVFIIAFRTWKCQLLLHMMTDRYLGLPWSAFLLAVVCNVRFLQSLSKWFLCWMISWWYQSSNGFTVQGIKRWRDVRMFRLPSCFHWNRILAHRAPRTWHQAHRAQGTGHLPIRSYSPALTSLAASSQWSIWAALSRSFWSPASAPGEGVRNTKNWKAVRGFWDGSKNKWPEWMWSCDRSRWQKKLDHDHRNCSVVERAVCWRELLICYVTKSKRTTSTVALAKS